MPSAILVCVRSENSQRIVLNWPESSTNIGTSRSISQMHGWVKDDDEDDYDDVLL